MPTFVVLVVYTINSPSGQTDLFAVTINVCCVGSLPGARDVSSSSSSVSPSPSWSGGKVSSSNTGGIPVIGLIGLPTISIPCGFNKKGLPIGIQLIGKFGYDKEVLCTSNLIEKIVSYT